MSKNTNDGLTWLKVKTIVLLLLL